MLTHQDALALARNCQDDRSRLWTMLLHDTGLNKFTILDLRRDDLWTHKDIPYLMVRDLSRFHGPLCRAPIRKATEKAFRSYVRRERPKDLMFPGNGATLALELEMCLHLAARNAGISKRFDSGTFRKMKVRAFREAGSRIDVVVNTMGWTREFGLSWSPGHRRPLDTLEEANEILKAQDQANKEIRDLSLTDRLIAWVMG
jgi:hypothetical protein